MNNQSSLLAFVTGLVTGLLAVAWGLPILPFGVVLAFFIPNFGWPSYLVALGAGLMIDLVELEKIPMATFFLLLMNLFFHIIASRFLKQADYLIIILAIFVAAGIYFIISFRFGQAFTIVQIIGHTTSTIIIGIVLHQILKQIDLVRNHSL